MERHLSTGAREPARRSSWTLTIGEHSATLVSIAQEQADHEASWKTTSTLTEKGPVRPIRDGIALDLESAEDSLFLNCWHRALKVATAGARRIPTPGRKGDCSDPGIWSPATLVEVDALVCSQGERLDDGQLAGLDGQQGDLDETLFRFLPAPGLELVEVHDDCFESTGLRVALE